MLRLRSNWMVIGVVPCDDDDDIDEMPAMVESCRSIDAGDRGRHRVGAGARQASR